MESTQQKIAIIEDNQDLLENMVEHLNIKGYLTWGANSAEFFYKRLLNHNETSIVIVDIGLPGESGLNVIEHLRKVYGMQHVIIITSAYGTVNDRLSGLKIGADCYMIKPIDVEELIENIKAISRSKYPNVLNNTPQLCWRLGAERWILISPSNKELPLTDREYRLLHILISAHGEIVSKLDIVNQVIGKNIYNGNERLDLVLTRLRKKTQSITNEILPIKTAHSIGYAFTVLAIVE